VNKKLAGTETDNLVGGIPLSGAADPEKLQYLCLAQGSKVFRLFKLDSLSPSPIVFKKSRQEFHTARAWVFLCESLADR
jgi:hypothetical protein